MEVVTFGTAAVPLHDGGWRPLPIVPDTKVPALDAWNDLCRLPWDRADLIGAAAEFSDHSCGLAATHGRTLFLDIDVLDVVKAEELHALADRTFGATPLIRVGLAPKAVLVYRPRDSAGIPSRRLHPIEIQHGSGQVVAYGTHPNGQAYRWIGGVTPVELPADSSDVPTVTAASLHRFLDAAFRIVPRSPASPRRRAVTSEHDSFEQKLRIRSLIVGFRRAAVELLETAIEGERHSIMWAVVAAAAGRGWSEDTVCTLLNRHFVGWAGVPDRALQAALDRCFGTRNARDD